MLSGKWITALSKKSLLLPKRYYFCHRAAQQLSATPLGMHVLYCDNQAVLLVTTSEVPDISTAQ
jgi:hypothetical protein